MSAATSDHDLLHGDEDFSLPADEPMSAEERDERAHEKARVDVCDPVYWHGVFDDGSADVTPTADQAGQTIARCMQSLDRACMGDRISLDAITAALHLLQKVALAEAYRDNLERA